MHWQIHSQINGTKRLDRRHQILEHLYAQRNLSSQALLQSFLNPPLPVELAAKSVGLAPKQLLPAVHRIIAAIDQKQDIAIYGDYDADGITATAILWETLHALGAKAYPFIPHRERHGYGLSKKGIDELLASFLRLNTKPRLIITVDNGIVAHEAAAYIKSLGIDLIITDHHQLSAQLPKADHIVHSNQISGAGVAWFFAREIARLHRDDATAATLAESGLDLLTIGTLADLMPLTGANRSFAKHGLGALSKTTRPGLLALKHTAGIDPDAILTSYHVGYVIAPRINAMGRLEHGMDALRLLCTRNRAKADSLAQKLDDTNRTRQDLTLEMVQLADQIYQENYQNEKIIIIDHPDFHEGIIGLIAGKLTEKYTKPSIIISRGNEVSKASARSPMGINIIDLIRQHEGLLINAGGHPGAAGLTLATGNIEAFRIGLSATALTIDDCLLAPHLHIDCQLELTDLDLDLYNQLNKLAPFGVGNPEPLFSTRGQIQDIRVIGRDNRHLKLNFQAPHLDRPLEALAWNQAVTYANLGIGQHVDLAFTLDRNDWNGRSTPQLIVKDLVLDSQS